MSLSEYSLSETIHPIDLVEHLAEHNDWEFDRVADDQIAMAVVGQWAQLFHYSSVVGLRRDAAVDLHL